MSRETSPYIYKIRSQFLFDYLDSCCERAKFVQWKKTVWCDYGGEYGKMGVSAVAESELFVCCEVDEDEEEEDEDEEEEDETAPAATDLDLCFPAIILLPASSSWTIFVQMSK